MSLKPSLWHPGNQLSSLHFFFSLGQYGSAVQCEWSLGQVACEGDSASR
jgi:hypothetical protein